MRWYDGGLMIFVDMNQFVISNTMSLISNDEFSESYLRYNLIKYLINYEKVYANYGQMVLAFDSKNYWRRDFFPNYKSNRKKERAKSNIDWDRVHAFIRQFKNEFENNLKYTVLEIDKCEADDIIAVLAISLSKHISLVISDDKDFAQLLMFDNIDLFKPRQKKFIRRGEINSSELHINLQEHIVRGDRSDGIPNILSEDNSISDGIRQRPITKKFLAEILGKPIDNTQDFYDKYLRNQKLISFSEIPESIKRLVLNTFKTEIQIQPRNHSEEYFKKHNILSLLN